MIFFRLRLWIRDLLRPLAARWLDLRLPEDPPPLPVEDQAPEVGRPVFDTISHATGQYVQRIRFAPGIEPHEITSAALNAAAIWNLSQKNQVAMLHTAYAIRVRWEIDLEPLDGRSVGGPEWDGAIVRRLIRGASGIAEPDGQVLPFRGGGLT